MRIEENYPLLTHNTFHLEATTRWFVEYRTIAELQELLQSDLLRNVPVFHIGAGSNVLFSGDYPGVILHSDIRFIEIQSETDEDVCLRVGSGVNWDEFVAYCVSHGWGGVENLSLIPGEVGASAVQNIGAYGVEVKDCIVEVETLEKATGKIRLFTNGECEYAYRESIFKKSLKGQYIVTSVTYRLQKNPVFELSYGNLKEFFPEGSEITLQAVRDVVIRVRQSKLPDPEVTGNAGSFFMNPIISRSQFERLVSLYPGIPHYDVDADRVKVPAAWMIDRCGWKGKQHGGAAVHDRQCLVLVNKDRATAADVMELATDIVRSVKENFGVEISPEVNYI